MRALSLRLGLITMMLFVLPGAASAKGPGLDHVVLDGPGIGDPIEVEKHYPYLLDDAVFMHVFGSATSRDIGRDRPGTLDLGPRFQLNYHMTFGEVIEIDFYPYSDKGPVAYAPSGQSVPVPVGNSQEDAEFPVHSGWYDYRPGMITLLQKQGLPTTDELDRGTPRWVFLAVGVALVVASHSFG